MNRSTLIFRVEVGDLWNLPWCGDKVCASLLHLIPSWSVMHRTKFHPCHCHSALICRAANGFIQHGSNHGNVRVSGQKSVWQVGTKKLASFFQAIWYDLIFLPRTEHGHHWNKEFDFHLNSKLTWSRLAFGLEPVWILDLLFIRSRAHRILSSDSSPAIIMQHLCHHML